MGALAWELSRLASMLAPALSGNGAALPLATGRAAFINAAGTAPVLPLRTHAGQLGGLPLGGESCCCGCSTSGRFHAICQRPMLRLCALVSCLGGMHTQDHGTCKPREWLA